MDIGTTNKFLIFITQLLAIFRAPARKNLENITKNITQPFTQREISLFFCGLPTDMLIGIPRFRNRPKFRTWIHHDGRGRATRIIQHAQIARNRHGLKVEATHLVVQGGLARAPRAVDYPLNVYATDGKITIVDGKTHYTHVHFQ